MITLEFLGAARTVTGSRFLLRAGQSTVLVDAGLFQGAKRDRLSNWEPFPVEIDSERIHLFDLDTGNRIT